MMNSGRLGWVSDNVRLGDEVALLAGSSVPMVLRRDESTRAMGYRHWLTGEAYVHGVMFGEAWPKRSNLLSDIPII